MKTGELCQSCNGFSEGRYQVVGCPICGNDVCNICDNLQLCIDCFELYDTETNSVDLGDIKFVKILEPGEEICEWQRVESKTT